MKRSEAVWCLIVAFIMITVGLVWLVGPWGMIACGVALGVVVLFMIDVDDQEHEA